MRLSRTEMFMLPLVLLGVAALALLAYRIVGFLGIGILGAMIALIAVRVDLEKASGLPAQRFTIHGEPPIGLKYRRSGVPC